MSKIVLIDGDSILYRVAFRGEELCDVDSLDGEDEGMEGLEDAKSEEYATSGEYQLHLPTAYQAIDYSIKQILVAWCDKLIQESKTDYVDSIEIYMTGKTGRLHCENIQSNFRETYVDDYKQNRVGMRPPAGLPELWEYIFSLKSIEGMPLNIYVADGAEADDIVVYLKTLEPAKYLLSALDKDVLYQSAGEHYNYGKQCFEYVDSLDAVKYLYYQMIVGDPSDGYKGVPGVGKVGGEKALKGTLTEKEMWDATLSLYKSKGLGLGEALQTGILASMHQVTSITYDGLVVKPEIKIFKAPK